MNKHRIYIDEVGNSDLGSAQNPNHRFLSLTGVICSLDYVAKVLQPQLERIKEKYFGNHPDDPIVFHRKELVNKKPPFSALRDPEIEASFNKELLSHLKKWEYEVITIVIDKLEHNNMYSTWKYDPYHYCLSILLERYVLFLKSLALKGDVMAESRGGKEDIRLKKSFRTLCDSGTYYIKPDIFANHLTSKELKVKQKSNNIAGLQIADLIAHPSRREILLENNLIIDNRNIFGDKIKQILAGKYYRNEDKIFGKKLLP